MPTRTLQQSQVAGLHVNEWPGGGTPVLCLPGVGSGGLSWWPLARSLPDARVIAPDLRGRGGSQSLTGPAGLLAHARDVKALVEELDLHEVVVIGHSMGAFLAPLVVRELGDRVVRVVLVDGGVPPKLPFFMRPVLTRALFRRQFKAMDRDWPDLEAVARKGKLDALVTAQPELRPVLLEVLAQEMGGHPDGVLRPRLDADRAVADAVDTFFGTDAVEALAALTVPTYLFAAEHAKSDRDKPFLSDAAIAPWASRLPCLTVRRLPGNHVTIVFDPSVAAAVESPPTP